MFRNSFIAIVALTSSITVYAGAAAGYEVPEAENLQCFTLAKGETLSIRASSEQLSEYQQIARALGKPATLKVKGARLQTFRYAGNTGNTAVLGFELENGLKFEAAADQLDQKTSDYTIEDDGGGYIVVDTGGNRVVLLDTKPARIDVLVTPEQMKDIEAKTSIVFEGGTGSLTVEEGQSALFNPTACQ